MVPSDFFSLKFSNKSRDAQLMAFDFVQQCDHQRNIRFMPLVDRLRENIWASLRTQGGAGAKYHGTGPACADLFEADESRDLSH